MLAACGADAAEPTASATPTESASPSQSEPSTAAFNALNQALSVSILQIEQSGVMEYYADGETATFTAVYDPNSTLDYRGAGLVLAEDTVELLLQLDMYVVWRVQTALQLSTAADVTATGERSFTLAIDRTKPQLEYFPAEMVVTLDADGLVASVHFPTTEAPDSVRVVYRVDAAGAEILQRANDEVIR